MTAPYATTGRDRSVFDLDIGSGAIRIVWDVADPLTRAELAGRPDPTFGLNFLLGEQGMAASGGRPPVCTVAVRAVSRLELPAVWNPSVTDRLETGTSVAVQFAGASWAWMMGDGVFLECGADPAQLTMQIVAEASRPYGQEAADAMVMALNHAVSQCGATMVHAACISCQPTRNAAVDAQNGPGVALLHAPSGAGKTTTALGLALHGHALQSDDTAILHVASDADFGTDFGANFGDSDGRTVMARGLPRDPRLHCRSVEMLPKLEPAIAADGWDGNGEQFVRRARMADLFIPPTARPLRALFALERGTGAVTVHPLDPYDALAELVRDNLTFGQGGFLPGHSLRMDLLTQALAQAPAYRVTGSGHPDEFAAAISTVLRAAG